MALVLYKIHAHTRTLPHSTGSRAYAINDIWARVHASEYYAIKYIAGDCVRASEHGIVIKGLVLCSQLNARTVLCTQCVSAMCSHVKRSTRQRYAAARTHSTRSIFKVCHVLYRSMCVVLRLAVDAFHVYSFDCNVGFAAERPLVKCTAHTLTCIHPQTHTSITNLSIRLASVAVLHKQMHTQMTANMPHMKRNRTPCAIMLELQLPQNVHGTRIHWVHCRCWEHFRRSTAILFGVPSGGERCLCSTVGPTNPIHFSHNPAEYCRSIRLLCVFISVAKPPNKASAIATHKSSIDTTIDRTQEMTGDETNDIKSKSHRATSLRLNCICVCDAHIVRRCCCPFVMRSFQMRWHNN